MQQNTTSHYLYALPLADNQTDIFALFNHSASEVSRWMEHFFTLPTWESDIHTDGDAALVLRHLYFEAKNMQRLEGQQQFAFGFPMYIDVDSDGKTVSAPLFTWYLGIRPHPNRRDSWVVSHDETHPVVVNEYVVQFIQRKYNVNFSDALGYHAQYKQFSLASLNDLCQKIAERLKFRNEHVNPGLRECPQGELLRHLATVGDIAWSGILGLFPHQQAEQVPIEPIKDTNSTIDTSQIHEFSPLGLDISQHQAFQTALKNRFSWVEGANGTGKTHTLLSLLLNALSNGQRALVVAPDVPHLLLLQQRLIDWGIGNLSFLLKDMLYDRALLADSLRTLATATAKNGVFNEDDYRITLKQARRWQQRNHDRYEALTRPLFGSDSWSEVVGLYLRSQQKVGRELLSNQLNPNDFKFTKDEYTQLKADLERADALFQPIGTLRHPLAQLHGGIFLEKNCADGRHFTNDQTDFYLQKFQKIQHEHIRSIDAHAQRLTDYYEEHFTQLSNQLQRLREDISDYVFQFGQDFESNSVLNMGKLQLYSVFSDRSAAVLKAKEELVLEYENLQKIFNSKEYKYFEHSFLKGSDVKNLPKVKQNLETFELALQSWRTTLSGMVNEQVQRFNSKTAAFFDDELAKRTAYLEERLDSLLLEFNDQKLYAEPLSHKMLTLLKRQQYIEETIEMLQNTKQNSRDFDTFYDWHRFWLSLPDNSRKLVQALIKVKPNDWQAAFESWYFHNVLTAHYDVDIPTNNDVTEKTNELTDRLQQSFTAQIQHLWQNRKTAALKAWKQGDKTTHQLLFANKSPNTMAVKAFKNALRNRISLLSEIYPVLLFTPDMANEMLNGAEKEAAFFDLLVVENTENLEMAALTPSIIRSERTVVSSDILPKNHAFIPDYLLGFMQQGNRANRVTLQQLHQSQGSQLHRLTQEVFYPNSIKNALNWQKQYDSTVEFVDANGRYNEQKQTNAAEAQAILQRLTEVSESPQRVYPRIGIITATIPQRNLINSLLVEFVQQRSPSWDKIEHLQRSGLTVLSIEEVQKSKNALTFEYLIVSGTFEHLTHNYFGESDFKTLLHLFSKKMIFVNSVPVYELQNNNTNFTAQILRFLQNERNTDIFQQERQEIIYSTSIFVQQVSKFLSAYIPSERIKHCYTFENQVFTLAILPEKGQESDKMVVISIDGYFSPELHQNMDSERKIAEWLHRKDINTVAVWSFEWWKDMRMAGEKLAQAIADVQNVEVLQ